MSPPPIRHLSLLAVGFLGLSLTDKSSAALVSTYFTFLHPVSYLTINQQFGREAVKSHSDQRQVISDENGQVF
jgi:hypothetical protein